ncbi:MAG TPA: GNAT family N-acetyltransferase [Acidimicrobiales bacterium]|nr:GNAT family N-acetyltransferase [Acidimicrobiales bacterium]
MTRVNEQADGVPVVIRPGTAADADAAARLHAGLITEGFLARLGPRFLRQLYRCVARGPDCFLLIAEGRTGDAPGLPPIAGFLAGALDLRALYRRFTLRHGLAAAVPSLPRLVGALPRVWETMRHGAGPATPDTAGAELLSVAVDPAWRGRHVGALLVAGFLDELDRRDIPTSQVVVGADNAPAVALYGRAGFTPVRTFELHRGTTSLLMRRPG